MPIEYSKVERAESRIANTLAVSGRRVAETACPNDPGVAFRCVYVLCVPTYVGETRDCCRCGGELDGVNVVLQFLIPRQTMILQVDLDIWGKEIFCNQYGIIIFIMYQTTCMANNILTMLFL